MKQDAGEVMACRIEAEQLTVEHVGKYGHRMPVALDGVCKCPNDTDNRDTRCNMMIVGDVNLIVVINKIKCYGNTEDGACDQCQAKTYEDLFSESAETSHLLRSMIPD